MDVTTRLLSASDKLNQFNLALTRAGKPQFWNGLFDEDPFHTDYRILGTVPPRFVVRWKGWRPALVLQQIYVIYLPDQTELTWDARYPSAIASRELTEEEKAAL